MGAGGDSGLVTLQPPLRLKLGVSWHIDEEHADPEVAALKML